MKTELDKLQKLGVIVPVKEATPWCAPIVVALKSNGTVRICVDLTNLNKAVCRERHILPSVDNILGQMAGATVFSKIDANRRDMSSPERGRNLPSAYVVLSGSLA